MQCELLYRPVSTIAQIRLEAGEQVLVEPGAMVGMSTNIDMKTGIPAGASGGMLGKIAGSVGRLLTGESFFQNTFTAQNGPGELLLTHELPGDMVWIDLPPSGLKVQSTAYIACTTHVQMQAELGGYRTFFSGEGLFVINATASLPNQKILLGAFGGIQKMPVDGHLLIDNGHLVAWDGNLSFNLTKASRGWISSFLSREGMVCRFTGQGNVWIQTRNPSEYGTVVGRMLPPRTN